MNNPFKFGTIVDGEYFTDRVAEQEKVREILASENHLILISPRRFGKTSLVQKVTKGLSRPVFQLNLQLVTDTADFAARLLRIVLQQYPMERLKHLITHFRFIPTISTNPMTDGIEVSFQPSMDGFILLEDVFTLIDKLGMKNPHKKPIVVLDEFQEIRTLDKNLDKKLRSILQTYNHANYIFLGSQESMMQEIFEKKKSPFYHFGYLMKLGKIPQDDFYEFLKNGFLLLGEDMDAETIGRSILSFTNCHPYYTQQLAYQTWNNWKQKIGALQFCVCLLEFLVSLLFFGQACLTMQMGTPSSLPFLRGVGIDSPSTAFSSLKRLGQQGYVIRNEGYELDDPFFRRWIEVKREG